MNDTVCAFTPDGLAEFSKWIRAGAQGNVPRDLFTELVFSKPMLQTDLLNRLEFRDRYDFGAHLVRLLRPVNSQEISFDRGLWAWLAAWYFEQLCPRNADGSRKLREENTYIPSETRIYYRHLVRTPWYLVATHGEAAKFLLVSPLNQQSYLLDQLAARQFIISSPTLIAAAKRLYTNPQTGMPRAGAGAKGPGSPRRLAIIANQLSLTFDIRAMAVEKFMALLPPEFRH
jgi:hypothetical protein